MINFPPQKKLLIQEVTRSRTTCIHKNSLFKHSRYEMPSSGNTRKSLLSGRQGSELGKQEPVQSILL